MFILYLVLSLNSKPVAITVEHTTKTACEQAAQGIREKYSSGSVLLAYCTAK